MELRILNTFLKVAQLQSFSKAAESLGYSQSAITVQVQQLENELGVRLFDRIGKNVSITHYGQTFVPYARDVIAAATRAANFAVKGSELTGTLRIGTLESLMASRFGEIIPAFHKRCPHVGTQLFSGSTEDLQRLLMHNELDLIYTLDDHDYDPQLVKLFRRSEEVVVMAGRQHPLAQASSLTLRDILEEPFILMPRTSNYRRLFDKELARLNAQVTPFLELDDTGMAIRMISENNYLTVLPKFASHRKGGESHIVALPVSDCHMEQWSQLIYHRDKVITPQIRAMAEVIADAVGVELHMP